MYSKHLKCHNKKNDLISFMVRQYYKSQMCLQLVDPRIFRVTRDLRHGGPIRPPQAFFPRLALRSSLVLTYDAVFIVLEVAVPDEGTS